MAKELKERKDMDPKYMWDLSTLFESDEAWEEALKNVDPCIKKVADFEGKLNSAENIRKYAEARTETERKTNNLFVYSYLRKCEDARNPKAQEMYQRAYAKQVEFMAAISFAEPEILSLPEEVLEAVTKDPLLSDYERMMTKLLREKPHKLSAAEEKIIASLEEALSTGRDVSDNLQDADLTFEPALNKDNESVEISQSNYILCQSGEDRILRENSFKSYYKSYKQHINTLAAAYNGNVKYATVVASLKHFGSSREMFMASENVPVSVYDSLIKVVRDRMKDMYRYVALRKKILGLSELHYYDIYAPLAGEFEKNYSYDEAVNELLLATEPLGKKYTDVVKKGVETGWIDVYPNKGKHSGAYSYGTYDSDPYILTNFVGNIDSVSTLVHEMGHSMHSYFSNHCQPPQDSEYTIFVAEVASTVNENLLIERLLRENKEKLDKEGLSAEKKKALKTERMSLLNQYLEGFKGTVFRQTMFAEFELRAHKAAEDGEALNAEKLNSIYEELIRDYFGEELVIDEEVKYEWARIPHFYTPFYVYKYATSYSAAVAISEAILKENDKINAVLELGGAEAEKIAGVDKSDLNPAVKRFIEFLSMGGSMDPLDELKHAGVDLSNPEAIERALDKFKDVLDEVESLISE